MKFKVEVTETLQRIIEVEATSLDEATTKVCVDYAQEKIVLDSTDCVGCEIKEYKEYKE